ncbi:MAG: hypothetical protein U1E61_06110 [Bradyrhizobium sp.]
MKFDVVKLPAAAFAFALALFVSSLPASACNGNGNCENAPGQNKDPKGAPAPLIGASIPGLALGYGAYWLIRRRRKA